MKLKLLAIFALVATLFSCDDETTGIGEFVAEYDLIPSSAKSFTVDTRTIILDSIYSRSSTAYLGKFTDEYYGEFEADFLAQINWPEDYELPDNTVEITTALLQLYYSSYYGDSLTAMRLQVDTLSKVIVDDGTDKNLYYTSLDPTRYIDSDAPAFAHKDYTAVVEEGVLGDSVAIDLGDDFCEYIMEKYNENDHAYFKDAESFINNVLKGLYIHVVGGEGCVLYIDEIYLNLLAAYNEEASDGSDSLVYTRIALAASKEVFISTRFKNNNLQALADDTSRTHLKSPAGVCTEVTLPFEEMYNDEEHKNDTINGATIVFRKYANLLTNPYVVDPPENLLMIRKSEIKTFFENNEVYDTTTSFLSTYDSTEGGYEFTYLNRLMSNVFNEIRPEIEEGEAHWEEWKEENPDWDKVVLLPVSLTYDSSSNVIGVESDMSITAAQLYGGEDITDEEDKIQIDVIYTTPTTK